MAELSKNTQNLINQYRNWHELQQVKQGVSTIHVDEIASGVASFYEKIRGIVDWREEHLFRRTAIERMLKRRFVLTNGQEKFAEPLVRELIRGGHFQNDKVEELKILDVQKSIDKYLYILKNNSSSFPNTKRLQFQNWLLSVASCEIEEILLPPRRERALINYMTELMTERIKVKEGIFVIKGVLTEEEKNTQIFIAVQRALFKLDSPILSYHLLKKRYNYWLNISADQLAEIARDIYLIWGEIEKSLNHPLADKFYRICERYDTPYLLLGDILSEENPLEVSSKISDPANLEELTKKAYSKRLSTLKGRLYRAAIYSTLSIFLTNIFSFLVLEIPLAKLITGTFAPITILVDILGPTFLMFLLVITIRGPSKSNLNVVIMETMKIVYQNERVDIYEIKTPKKRGLLTKFLVFLFYISGAFISLGLVVWAFQSAGFPPTSVLINLIFVALIAFAGLATREKAQELTVEEGKGNIFGFFFDILFLPVAGLGRWLSNKWRKYNAIAVFFIALIDMPFQIFIEFLEQWRFFLKEKKEEIH